MKRFCRLVDHHMGGTCLPQAFVGGEQVLTALAQAKEEDLLQECIQAFTDVATVEPDFFKAQLAQNLEPAKFMATVARTREACESGLRGLAIEWLVSYVEKRHKFLSKSAPDFINLTLECCLGLILCAAMFAAAVRQPDAEVEDVPLDDDSTSEGGNSPPCRGDPMQSPEESEAPARVWASKGITGLLETVGGRRVEEEVLENSVLLNVYDVSDSDVIQRVNRVFHAGVEVYGKEWCYGATVPGRSGVGAVKPRLHPQHRYRATVHMGNTEKSPDEISRILVCMAPGSAYDLIHHNCLTFCNVLLGELGLRRIPGWASELAGRAQEQLQSVGASIWQWGQSFQESVGMSEAAVPNLSDIGKKAEDNWQSFSDSLRSWGENVTKDLKQTLEGSKPGKAGAGAGGYRTETDRCGLGAETARSEDAAVWTEEMSVGLLGSSRHRRPAC
eukprot:g32196.t1